MTEDEKKQFDEWLSTRPPIIQELGKKYPPGDYRIKEGAPYSLSCPGTKVTLVSYLESGNVGVAVMAEDKLPPAIEHERKLCEQYGKDFEEATKQNVRVDVDPVWLEKIDYGK